MPYHFHEIIQQAVRIEDDLLMGRSPSLCHLTGKR